MAVLFTSRVFLYYKSVLKRLQTLSSSILEIPETSQALVFPQQYLPGGHALEPEFESEKELDCDEKHRGFLWAVPKKRVSVERRLTRRVAHTQKWNPKTNFLICNVCGHYHLAHTICGNCYNRVKQETNEMKEVIQEKLKLDPVDKEVVVLYQNEPKPKLKKNELLVEIPKERPPWFSRNLLSKGNEFSVNRKLPSNDPVD